MIKMMRKEQNKDLQEKQSFTGKTKVGDVLNLCEGLLDSKEEEGIFVKNNDMEVSAVTPASSHDSEKSSRLLVPSGSIFNQLEKSSALKSLINLSLSEISNEPNDASAHSSSKFDESFYEEGMIGTVGL